MLKSREHKKNKDTNSVIGGGNNVKKEEINTSNECVMAQENVQIQIQPCYLTWLILYRGQLWPVVGGTIVNAKST